MRKALAHAFVGQDGDDEDILAAVGMAQCPSAHVDDVRELSSPRRAAEALLEARLVSLGKTLYVIKFSQQAKELEEAVNLLGEFTEAQVRRMKADRAKRVAQMAITRWVEDMCPHCGGAGERQTHEEVEGKQPMTPCEACNGQGMHRFARDGKIDTSLGIIRRAVSLMLETFGKTYGRET